MNFRLPKTSISGLLLSAALITAAALPLQGQSIPTISNITPSTVSPGDTITITGTSFCTRRPQQTSVTFAGAIKGTVLSLSATSIQAQVPAGAVSGPVVVRSCRQTSTGYPI